MGTESDVSKRYAEGLEVEKNGWENRKAEKDKENEWKEGQLIL